MKRVIALCGLVGLVGCFLPLTLGLSLFDLRQFSEGWHIWMVIAAFAIPTFVGFSTSEGSRTTTIVGVASFGYLLFKFGTGTFDLLVHGSLGGLAMGAAMIGGLCVSGLGLLERSA